MSITIGKYTCLYRRGTILYHAYHIAGATGYTHTDTLSPGYSESLIFGHVGSPRLRNSQRSRQHSPFRRPARRECPVAFCPFLCQGALMLGSYNPHKWRVKESDVFPPPFTQREVEARKLGFGWIVRLRLCSLIFGLSCVPLCTDLAVPRSCDMCRGFQK